MCENAFLALNIQKYVAVVEMGLINAYRVDTAIQIVVNLFEDL